MGEVAALLPRAELEPIGPQAVLLPQYAAAEAASLCAQVETMLQRIRGLFESIEEKFCGSHTPHEFVDAQGGEQLIASLERAVGGHSMIGHEKRP